MTVQVLHGDCLLELPKLAANSIDAICCDPPYHLISAKQTAYPNTTQMDSPHRRVQRGFMGKEWDGGDIAFRPDVWRECLRVLRPGAHMAVFGGSRTHHRVWCAVEDAGFEIRDTLAWITGQGFPKSLDVSKAIDKHLGAEREVIGSKLGMAGYSLADNGRTNEVYGDLHDPIAECSITAPATPEAQQWQGWGTALKPSHEPILLARKPLIGTVAANVLTHGTGALNIDASRVGTETIAIRGHKPAKGFAGDAPPDATGSHKWNGNEDHSETGRWPPNLLLSNDEEVLECFPSPHGAGYRKNSDPDSSAGDSMFGIGGNGYGNSRIGDEGSAARFFPSLGFTDDERRVFYCPKAGKSDRAGSKHPTVKPIKLMEWLCRLITPPNGTILDPFAGSGTTGQAAMNCGFDCILIEREDAYVADIQRRMGQSDGFVTFTR